MSLEAHGADDNQEVGETMKPERMAAAVLTVWAFMAALALTFWGFVIWAIYRVVTHYTGG